MTTPQSSNARRRQRRRHQAAERRHGIVNPLYWPCPTCLADRRQNCRTSERLPENFHTDRLNLAHYGYRVD
jgi:hypothetical protein